MSIHLEQSLLQQVETVLAELRPAIQMDGGNIELVSVNDGVVSVRLHGACTHCPMSLYTLKLGVQERLIEQVPGIREVVAVE